MGGDGNSIPTRGDLVRVASSRRKGDAPRPLDRWTRCVVSEEPLREPVVVDECGSLMNKDALIERHLLVKEGVAHLSHVRALSDVVGCVLTRPADGARQPHAFVCPVTGLAGNGRHGFVVLRACGCVLSERAWKEVPRDACPACGAAAAGEERGGATIPVLPPREEAARLAEVAKRRRAERKRDRKRNKKKGKRKAEKREGEPGDGGKKRARTA